MENRFHTLPSNNFDMYHFANWLKEQPDNNTFSMGSVKNCVLGQYFVQHAKPGIKAMAGSNDALYLDVEGGAKDYRCRIEVPYGEKIVRALIYSNGYTFKDAKRVFYKIFPEHRPKTSVPWWNILHKLKVGL